MYFVDREKIGDNIGFFRKTNPTIFKSERWSTPLEKAALERVTHLMIESLLDVGNAMIDGFIMRDPGSYDDIIDILIDEKVITAESGKSLKILIQIS